MQQSSLWRKRDVTSQVDVNLAGYFKVIGGPCIPLRVEQVHSAVTRDRNQRVSLSRLTIEFRRLEVHERESTDDFEMAQLFGANVHQKILAIRILAIQPLGYCIAAASSPLAPPNCSRSIL